MVIAATDRIEAPTMATKRSAGGTCKTFDSRAGGGSKVILRKPHREFEREVQLVYRNKIVLAYT